MPLRSPFLRPVLGTFRTLLRRVGQTSHSKFITIEQRKREGVGRLRIMMTTFLRDQLVACLRESFPTPLRVPEILFHIHKSYHGAVYRNLRALERAGLVCRCSAPGDKRVYWTYLPDKELAHAIEALEKLVV